MSKLFFIVITIISLVGGIWYLNYFEFQNQDIKLLGGIIYLMMIPVFSGLMEILSYLWKQEERQREE